MAEPQNYSIETLITALADVGYTDVKKLSDKKVAVLTDKNRVSTLEDIQIKLRGQYDPSPSSESSVGRVRVQQFQILAKPAGKQGKASAGVGNEDFLIDWINNCAKTGPINVIFKSPNDTYVVNGCKKATSVGTDTAGGIPVSPVDRRFLSRPSRSRSERRRSDLGTAGRVRRDARRTCSRGHSGQGRPRTGMARFRRVAGQLRRVAARHRRTVRGPAGSVVIGSIRTLPASDARPSGEVADHSARFAPFVVIGLRRSPRVYGRES